MSVEQYIPQNKVDIHCSQTACERLIKVIQSTPDAVGMRLSIKKTGCSGYAYDLQVTTQVNPEDLTTNLDANHILYIDKKAYLLMEGLKIDYVKQGLQAKFLYQNPKQTGQCGCGESFSLT